MAFLLGCGGPPEERVAENSAALNATACNQLLSFKAGTTQQAVACSENLSETYRQLHAACSGIPTNHYQTEFAQELAQHPVLAASLAPSRLSAWQTLEYDSKGLADVRWDKARLSPTRVELGRKYPGANGPAALAALEASAGSVVRDLFGMSSSDVLVPRHDRSFQDGGTRWHPFYYTREHAGLPVFGDHYTTMLRTSDSCSGKWVASVHARWTTLGAVQTAPVLTPSAAVSAAVAEADLSSPTPTKPASLGICTEPLLGRLCYEVWLGNSEGEVWAYHVAADDGSVLWSDSQVRYSSGNLKLHVGLPHDGSAKNPRALPHAYIYEDGVVFPNETIGCSPKPTIDVLRGDPMLGETNYWGNYSGLTPQDPNDTLWTVDYRGSHVKDQSVPVGSPPEPWQITLGDFDSSLSSYTFPQSTLNWRSRRGEIFYLLNYSWQSLDDAYVSQWTPIQFHYYEWGTPLGECQNPSDYSDVEFCITGADGPGCVRVEARADLGSSAPPVTERRFRQTIFHEHGHNIQTWWTNGQFPCSNTGCDSTHACGCWIEGFADAMAFILTRHEGNRPNYRPDKKWPDILGETAWGTYYMQQIFTALYGHYALRAGFHPALRCSRNWNGQADNDTQMAGPCPDNGDGIITHSECEPNSFYRHMIDCDYEWSAAKKRTHSEISSVFYWHVTDVDASTPDPDPIGWADDLPNLLDIVPPFRSPEFAVPVSVSGGPHDASGPLYFNYRNDYDTMTFMGRAGETYIITTDIPPESPLDTVLEILAPTGLEDQVAFNDDCGGTKRGPLHSCITFFAEDTGLYRVRVSAYNDFTPIGPDYPYSIEIATSGDDYPDSILEASPIAPDDAAREGNFATVTDHDVFRFVVGTAAPVSYLPCSAALSVAAVVLDESGAPVPGSSFTNQSCGSSYHTVSLGKGVYFLDLSSAGGTGAYELRLKLNADIDVDSTPANAWPLEIATGRLTGTMFETATDEDWYSFEVPAGGLIYAVETFMGGNVAFPGAYSDTVLEIYAPSATAWGRPPTEFDSLAEDTSGFGLGHWMLQDDGGGLGDDRHARIAFIAPVAGTYYVRVRNTGDPGSTYYLLFDYPSLYSPSTSFP